MITMEMLGKIRRMHLRDKMSVRAIAKRTGLSRNTLQKWLQTPEEVKVPKYVRTKGFSKLGIFADELEQALKADAKRNKQDRRTGKALFIQIKASGYGGGYTRVTDFIRAWRASAGKDVKAFVPLRFDLGEAFQFDWSEEGLVVGGIYHRMQVSHMKLCASRAFWLVAYPSQGHEMLFDAHTRCRALWDEIRHPEYKQFSVAEMLEQERSELMPMPTVFDGYVERSAKVSSTCLVAVAKNRYSVPCELAGQRVSTRLYPSRVEVASDEAIVASHARVANHGHICYDWQHYIALIQRKPGALRNGAPFADMPAPLLRLRQGLMRHEGGDKTMAQVLNCVPSHGLEAVLVAVELVIESGALSTEHVLNVLARLNAVPVPESVESSLHLREAPVANTGRYDSLRGDAMMEVTHAS